MIVIEPEPYPEHAQLLQRILVLPARLLIICFDAQSAIVYLGQDLPLLVSKPTRSEAARWMHN